MLHVFGEEIENFTSYNSYASRRDTKDGKSYTNI